MNAGRGTQKRDFLARCFEAQAKFPDIVTDRMILMYNSDNVGAGSDTTGISLRAVSEGLSSTKQPSHNSDQHRSFIICSSPQAACRNSSKRSIVQI